MIRLLLVLLVSTLFVAEGAQAGAIATGSWVGFCFTGVGSGATTGDGCQNSASQTSGNPFTFALTSPGVLKVTDAFQQGDQFSVFSSGVLLFDTSVVRRGFGLVADPSFAFADPSYSHGSASLVPGAYSIDVYNTVSPFGGGGAYLGVFTSSVPEPETYAMLLAGLGFIGFIATRCKNNSSNMLMAA